MPCYLAWQARYQDQLETDVKTTTLVYYQGTRQDHEIIGEGGWGGANDRGGHAFCLGCYPRKREGKVGHCRWSTDNRPRDARRRDGTLRSACREDCLSDNRGPALPSGQKDECI